MNTIEELRNHLKMNKNQFAKFIGVDNAQITMLEGGKRKPGKTILQKIKNVLPELNADWFFEGKGEMFLSKEAVTEVDNKVLQISVYGKISAGKPIQQWDDIIDIIRLQLPLPNILKGSGKLLGLRVSGDSMYPRYMNGDFVFCEDVTTEYKKIKNTSAVVTLFKSEPETTQATIKLINWKDNNCKEFTLYSINAEQYPPSNHRVKEVARMFKIIGMYRDE